MEVWWWVPHFPLNAELPLHFDMKELTFQGKPRSSQFSARVLGRGSRGTAA